MRTRRQEGSHSRTSFDVAAAGGGMPELRETSGGTNERRFICPDCVYYVLADVAATKVTGVG